MATASVHPAESKFRVDVTPPIGDGPCVGAMPTVTSIEHPLEIRGVVLRTASDSFVIASIDYCGICNTSDETIRDAMARAAGMTRQRVALQSRHQHTAPTLDADAVRLLHGKKCEQLARHLRFTDEIAKRAAAIARCEAAFGEGGRSMEWGGEVRRDERRGRCASGCHRRCGIVKADGDRLGHGPNQVHRA